MAKRYIGITIIFTAVLSFAIFHDTTTVLAASTTLVIEDTQILAPDGLGTKEKAAMEKKYRYDYRQKDIILKPDISTDFTQEPLIAPLGAEILTEQEKLYRYFGIASVLQELGRFEEAIEILKYIQLKRPNDKYIENYLRGIQEEAKIKKTKWDKSTRKDAVILKEIKIKNLMQEGTAYYNQKRFDTALVRFVDVVNLDPGNATAKRYLDKLKKYYRDEIGVENIIRKWGYEMTGEEQPKSGEQALYAFEGKDREIIANKMEAAERLLDKEEIQNVVEYAKVNSMMEQAELDVGVEDIINQRMEEERKKYSYTLGPGDVVQVSVQDHPELSGRSTVGIAGDIMLPLVNEPVEAQGLTLVALQEKVVGVLERYVKDPSVYIGIVEYQSKVFYVIDEEGCTPYSITRANFTLRDALFIADWGGDRALGRVLVMKPHKLHPIIKKVDAFDLVYRGNLARNVRIEDGDVIYVPMTMASKVTQTISDSLSPFAAVRDVREEWLSQRWNQQQGWYNIFRIPRTSSDQADYREIDVSANN
ncbi:MAG: hypothetical protein A2Z72_04730 [Omnitrophica bacterium RBG_13_46_9]|nr:MAG: hypothetical protein A2Z72_04730 [Omnitrophica bacterium RBG_13_46_9]